jgi:hypothetical protein
MIKKPWALTVATLLISLACVMPTPAQADKESQRVARVKGQVNKVGVDENVEVRLTDSSKLQGRITIIGDDYFVLVDRKTGDATTLRFAQVKQIRGVLDNPFSDPAVLVGLALIPAIIVLSVLAKRAD